MTLRDHARRAFRTFSRLVHGREGVAAIEFAMTAPLLLILFAGSIELHNYLRVARLLDAAADSVAALVANRRSVKDMDLNLDFNSTLVTFPPAASNDVASFYTKLGHRISHIAMKPTDPGCKRSCTYQGDLAWTWMPRYTMTPFSCGAFNPGPADAAPSGQTLPAEYFGPASVVVVELTFDYAPLFGAQFMKPFQMKATAFSSSRFAQGYIKAAAGTSFAIICPGY